ncbi:MAG: phosphopantetheine-protein transferase [Legionella sp.]|nr:MAG: phosphopantetheine-protein transferase [Legionella sp.]
MLKAKLNSDDPAFLSIPADDYTLAPGRIDIWEYPLDRLWPEAESLLNAEEYARSKRYHFQRHQRRFTIARAMLRLILARYLNTQPNSLEFITNAYGKPSIARQNQIQFNLSHSRDLALLSIGQTHPMGIDLEYFSGRPFQGIGQLMFSPAEINDYSKVPSSMRSLAFFHIWAQKEAFIKACGMGLSYPTQTFDVPVMPPTDAFIEDLKHRTSWHMTSFMPQIACCAALCYHPTIQTIRYSKDTHVFIE